MAARNNGTSGRPWAGIDRVDPNGYARANMAPSAPPASKSPTRGLLRALREARRESLAALFWELVRFSWVGFFTLGMYAGEMWLLGRLNAWPTWLNATLAYGPCLVTNYFLHRAFTFRSDKQHLEAGPRYLVIQLGGMAINTSVLWVGVDRLNLPYLPAQFAAVATLGLWSYLGQKLWTFDQP
jgi:putative flippase GtrA